VSKPSIRIYGDPVLRTKAKQVRELDAEVHDLVERMAAVMCENEGVGLAAPQVGSLWRVIVARPDTEEDTEIFRLINPRIIVAEGSQEGMEGCLSLPSLRGDVKRSAQVAVEAMTPAGKNITIEATGLLARVFEHEIDHLNSVLFVDRAAADTLCWLIPDPDRAALCTTAGQAAGQGGNPAVMVVFWGTPSLAAQYLSPLADRHELVGVVTQPDRPKGRSRNPSAPPVKQEAVKLGCPVLQPADLMDCDFQEQLRQWAADAFVVVAYGRILPPSIIEMPDQAAVNVHYSLLPELRGAAPVQHALMQGLTETGVTVQYIAQELDAGDIVIQQSIPIEPGDNTATLTQRLTNVGIRLLLEALELIGCGEVTPQPQDHAAATYAPPLTREDGIINWCRPAPDIVNQIRACYPWPGSVCWRGDQRIKISNARAIAQADFEEGNCGQIVEIRQQEGFVVQARPGGVLVTRLQPAGRQEMSAADFLRGARLNKGARFESITYGKL